MEGMEKQISRCVVVGASPFEDAASLKAYLREEDFIIAADGGSRLLAMMGRQPHLIIGDFDSSACPERTSVRCEVLPTHKDDTDVLAAVRVALGEGYREFLFLGCLGGRLDHTLANLFVLRFLHSSGATGCLVDERHEVTLLSSGTHIVPHRDGYYFSLLPLGGSAEGVSINGAEYSLENAVLDTQFPLGVSNAFCGKSVRITLKNGFLLLILAKKD